MREYSIYILHSEEPFTFTGHQRRDLDTENWHYYERSDGTIIHFRKENMVAIFERNKLR